jgi:predicted O-methyltransferase YrrM
MNRAAGTAVIVLSGGVLLAAAGGAGWGLHGVLGGNAAATAATAASEGEAAILHELASLKASKQAFFAVPEGDGRILRMLAESIGARHVVEIGTSSGYSGLWLCLGMRQTGGRLTTFEIDPGRAAAARELFRRAGVADRTTVVVGDAHQNVPRLHEPVDLVFLDADKDGYVDYLRTLAPLLRSGGLIVAHNMKQATGYIEYLEGNPAFDTVLLTQGSGLAVTLKKR